MLPLPPIETRHLFREINAGLLDLCATFSSDDWAKPTVHPDRNVKDLVAHLLDARELTLENSDVVRQALDVTRGTEEFTDALIALTGLAAGCDHTVTFDRRAATVAGMRFA